MKYQGLVFHVQTEDSGTQLPRVVTHIFIGGTIVATVKTPYDAELSRPDIKDVVTDLMQSQHKTMLKGLIHGTYDAAIAQMRGFAQKLDGPAPINVASGQNRSSFGRQAERPAAEPVAAAPQAPPVAGRPVAQDAARPDLQTRPPPLARPASVPPPRVQPAPAAKAPIPVEEQGYAEAQLIEADDQAVDSLFGNLISEKTLDEVILSFLGTDKPKK